MFSDDLRLHSQRTQLVLGCKKDSFPSIGVFGQLPLLFLDIWYNNNINNNNDDNDNSVYYIKFIHYTCACSS